VWGRGARTSRAIANNLREMSAWGTGIVCIIGEGGSGGALGSPSVTTIPDAGERHLQRNLPEGCSAILWKDQNHVEAAADALRITASDLLGLGVIDEIVPEPPGGAQLDFDAAAELLDGRLNPALESLRGKTGTELREQRYQRFRRMGAVVSTSR